MLRAGDDVVRGGGRPSGDDCEADLVQLYPKENGHRAREGMLLRRGAPCGAGARPALGSRGSDPLGARWKPRDACSLQVGSALDKRREAIARVRPWAVDASRSLEAEPGIKDHARVRAFVDAARAWSGR